jgi:nitroreductase
MDFVELIKKRSSVRSYTNKPIPPEVLGSCLEAARLAPSACNAQPFRYIVVDKRELIGQIAEKVCYGIYSFNNFIKDAACLLLVVSDKEGVRRKIAGFIKKTDYYLIDLGIACEHFLLRATEMGLGTCWIGWFDEKKLKQLLGVPRSRRIDVIIALGYPQEPGGGVGPRKELKDIVSYNKY